jgi:hypothetical protein
MDYQVDFTKAYKDLYEGIAAKGGVMGKGKDDEEKKPAAKPDAKAKGGDKKDGEGDESAVKQAVYDIRYRAKREGVPVAQAMTDYLKHSASLGPKARAELKKKLLGEENVEEAYTVTAADKKGNTKAYQNYKAGMKGKDGKPLYKAADHMKEVYKGKHGQTDKQYADSRSSGGKMVSGDSKMSGAEYTHGRRVKAANPGMQPDVGGKTKPKSQGKMDSGTRTDLQYRKANLKAKKEEYTLGELKAILEDDSLAHLHADVFDLVESFLIGEEVIEEESSKKSQKGETLYKVRVVNNDDRAEVRYASRAKISQLRSNDNIKSVEITGHGDAYNEKPKKGGEKKLDPVGKEDGDVDNDGDQDSSDKYLMKRRKAIGKAIAKEESEVDECWKTHKKVGMKMKGGKLVNDCRPKNEEVEEVDENRAAARSAGGYKDDSKKQPDPSKKGFTGIGNMSIDQIRKMSARIEKEKSAKK